VTHTLECGDCLELMKEIPAGSVDMVLCDLPYGTTQNKWDSVIPFELLWKEYRRACKRNAAMVFTAIQPFTSALVMSNPGMFKYDWTWRKPKGTGHLNAKKQPLRDKEDIIVFYEIQPAYNPQWGNGEPYNGNSRIGKKQQTSNYGTYEAVREDSDGRRYPKQVIEFNVVGVGGEHPTQKPVALFEYLIRTYTNPGENVLDNCCGSGTTGVACANTGRSSIQFELSPEYVAIARRRLDQALNPTSETGQAALFTQSEATPA